MSKPVGKHEDGTRCWTENCGRGKRQEITKRLSYREKQALPEYTNRFKKCRSCNRTQPLYEFAARQKSIDGFDNTCRGCKKEYNSTYYTNNKEDLDLRSSERGALLKEINQAYITSYKQDHPCIDCGMENILVLDFDHRDNSNKKVNIGEVAHRFTLHRLKEEIGKCDVRCANCHRIKTYAENSWRTGHIIETKNLGRVQRNNALAKMKRQEEMRRRMQHGCVDCSNKDIRVLEFDHVRGEKIAHISDMVRNLVAWDVFSTELDKCDVRCANCHRIVTRQREQTVI